MCSLGTFSGSINLVKDSRFLVLFHFCLLQIANKFQAFAYHLQGLARVARKALRFVACGDNDGRTGLLYVASSRLLCRRCAADI